MGSITYASDREISDDRGFQVTYMPLFQPSKMLPRMEVWDGRPPQPPGVNDLGLIKANCILDALLGSVSEAMRSSLLAAKGF